MKKFIFVLIFLGTVSIGVQAQDDMYFTPKKSSKDVKETAPVIYDDNPRDVDEYNRRGQFRSNYYSLDNDSAAADTFVMLPDSSAVDEDGMYYAPEDDYTYSRRMSRFDDFYWYDPWYYGWYGPYWYGSPYWYSHYGWGWYDPWYDPWYYGYYRPWGYYGWGGWHHVGWEYAYHRPYSGMTGTRNHGLVSYGNGRGYVGRSYRGSRGDNNSNVYSGGSYRGNRSNVSRYNSTRSNNNNTNSNYRSSRSNGYNQSSSSRQSYGSGSSSFGGGHSGGFHGGGSFGGGRSGGGGGHFGGRR